MTRDVVIAARDTADVRLALLPSLDIYIFTGVLAPIYVDAWIQDTMDLWLTDDGLVWAGVA